MGGKGTVHTLAAAAIDVDTVTKDIASIATASSITPAQRRGESNFSQIKMVTVMGIHILGMADFNGSKNTALLTYLVKGHHS